jgi:hypothetical protein
LELSNLSFLQKREKLELVREHTNEMIAVHGEAFDKAIEQLTDSNKVSVTLDPVVSQLIEDGIKLHHSIMKSYM